MKYIESVYDVELLHNIILQFKNNPNWTASHVAAELEITECFENVDFMNEMENSLKSDDITPLHIACKVSHQLIRSFLSCYVSISIKNFSICR